MKVIFENYPFFIFTVLLTTNISQHIHVLDMYIYNGPLFFTISLSCTIAL